MNAPIFAPAAEDLRRQLPDLGEGLASQCAELHGAPTAERAERFAHNLAGAHRLALALRERLLAEDVRHER